MKYVPAALIIPLLMINCTKNLVNSELPLVAGLADTTISISDTLILSVDASDPDGIGVYYWQFSDDSLVQRDTTSTGTITHIFPAYATACKVTVWAVDGLGGKSADSAIITVLTDPPSADIVAPVVVRLGTVVKAHCTNLSAGLFGKIESTRWSVGGFNSFNSENVCTVTVASPAAETDSFPCILRIIDDDHNVIFDTCYIAFNTHLWENVGYSRELAGLTSDVDLVTDEQGTPYVAFTDQQHGDGITVGKFSGNNWQLVGDRTVSPSVCGFSLAIHHSTPYLFYNDRSQNYNGMILHFNGASWDTVASPVFTDQRVCGFPLIINNQGQFYVPYVTDDDTRIAMILTFTQNRWSKLGTVPLDSSCWWYIDMAITTEGKVFAAYQNKNGTMAVKQFDGSGWSFAGTQPVSAYEYNTVDMVVDKANTPYLAYTGTGASGTTVLKYENGQWQNLDRPSLAGLPSWGTSIAIDSLNAPVIAFMNHNGNYRNPRVKVMRFDGTTWRKVGFPYENESLANVNISVDNNNNYFIAHANRTDSTVVVKCYR